MIPPFDPGPVSIDEVLDAIEIDVMASRDDVVTRATAMLNRFNRELTRLQVLEDCAATLKSANDSAVLLLQDAAARAALAAADEPEMAEGRRRWR